MLRLIDKGIFTGPDFQTVENPGVTAAEGASRTISCRILKARNQSGGLERLKLKFDALVSPDNNYVSILQTARASGLERFPVP